MPFIGLFSSFFIFQGYIYLCMFVFVAHMNIQIKKEISAQVVLSARW